MTTAPRKQRTSDDALRHFASFWMSTHSETTANEAIAALHGLGYGVNKTRMVAALLSAVDRKHAAGIAEVIVRVCGFDDVVLKP